MRAISRVLNVPLGTVFTWIKRYGRQRYEKLVYLFAKGLVKGLVAAKVVDGIWITSNTDIPLPTLSH